MAQHRPAGFNFSILVRLLRSAFGVLQRNDPLRMAGATAFFTTFALPPILVILIQLLKRILNPRYVRAELFKSLSEIVGPEAVEQTVGVLMAFRQLAQNTWITIGGAVFLVFVATTLFTIISNSINQIWKIRPQKRHGLAKRLRTRGHAVVVILIAGMLFLIGLVAEALQSFIGRAIFDFSPLASFYFNTAVSKIVSLIIVTLWFGIMFRYLPDARPRWPIALVGGFVTSLLFAVGRIILRVLLSYSNLNTLYGTSASVVLLLLFVFYAALILYFGAAFTKVWAQHRKTPIAPLAHAMHYRLVETPLDEED
ncbi:YihY/virulence factor BrkB family protein [Paracnuella aquatica]|uniref:YihY/virulence factor BrkB family protein n=1 Tax=Paracnuella aquatica TaxID=2268757 RepID=UPI000DEF7C5E|nr:YihY/virulence factor BrkB family protein [Paracnuella aquatica]RPD43834.1 YihY/virulence factor BrkB family protein [Paracnuella aquatica]